MRFALLHCRTGNYLGGAKPRLFHSAREAVSALKGLRLGEYELVTVKLEVAATVAA